jgi:hypothetical protein
MEITSPVVEKPIDGYCQCLGCSSGWSRPIILLGEPKTNMTLPERRAERWIDSEDQQIVNCLQIGYS